MLIINSNDEALSYLDWRPGANTMLYVPMETDLLDHSGNNVSITNVWVSLNTSVAGVWVWYFNGNSRLNFPSSFFNMSTSDFTVCVRCRDGSGNGNGHGSIFNNQWTLCSSLLLRYEGTKLYAWTRDKTRDIRSDVWAFDINQDTRVLWTITRQGSSWKVYKNKTLKRSGTNSKSLNYNASYTGAIGGHEIGNPNYYIGYMSRFIVENKARSQSDLNDYYDKVKNKLGI